MKRYMPFWIWPRHWGLKGTAKELAEIDYYFSGYEADKKKINYTQVSKFDYDIADNEIELKYNKISEEQYEINLNDIRLNHDKINNSDYEKRKLEIDVKFGKISQREFEESLLEFIENEKEREIEALKFALRHDEITQNEYDKAYSDIEDLPWFNFDAYYDQDTGQVVMTFDYNQSFWLMLKRDGHPGDSEQEIIDNYIRDWGRKMSNDELADDTPFYESRNTELLYSNNDGIKVYR